MTRLTVDADQLLIGLLSQSVDPVVLPSLDVDSVTDIPVLLVSTFNGHMISNGAPNLGWEWSLGLTLLSDGDNPAQASDDADSIYQAVHLLEGRQLPGVGAVATVEDESMFSRGPTVAVDQKTIVQHDATFTVRVRPLFQ